MKYKKIDIELMRILACFFVIFNHTSDNGFFLFSLYDKNSIQFWIYMFISIFCKFSVPLFMVITGALLLDREQETDKKNVQRIIKMIIILIVWSFAYYIVLTHKRGGVFNLKHFFITLYDSTWNMSYWYLYAYIALLITLPVLRKIARALDNKTFIYMFGIVFLFNSIIPAIQFILFQGRHSLNSSLNIPWMSCGIFLYPLLGYFLEHRLENYWNSKKLSVLWIFNLLCITCSCYLTYIKANQITGGGNKLIEDANAQAFFGLFVIINTITIYVTCKMIVYKHNIPNIICRIIKSVGECTFGIYLLHLLYERYISCITMLWTVFHDLHLNYMVCAFLYCLVVFVLGYITTLAIRHIPILKEIV